MTQPQACPDPAVYERVGRLERGLSNDRVRWDAQEERNGKVERDLDRLCDAVTRLSTTIKVAAGIIGFLVALAGIVVPLLT